jgi:hypothetical protein
VAGETHPKENVQTKSPPKDGPIYTKNGIERPTKVMTQSGSDDRVAVFVREEVATGEEFGNGDDWLELGPEDIGKDNDEGVAGVEETTP